MFDIYYSYGSYFTNINVREQAQTAVDIVNELWPQYEHIFVYDNATTHRKRPDDALSALKMPKAPSGSSARHPDANIVGKRKKRDVDGKLVYNSEGKVILEDVPMIGAKLPSGEPQDLYFPVGHAKAGKFKGMQIVLEERGIAAAKLPTQCPKFKCADTSDSAACCCRRILFNQPDFVNVKSMLKVECEARGIQVLFTPRFHCELNPIEMVSRRTLNGIEAIDGVPLLFMRRFVNRSHRFADGYFNKHLSGPEAAWAARKYHGHRTFPTEVLDLLLKAKL
ncbi:hypothetical protein MIND_00872700 [Mycena indigotica]|uniref:Uncharacterized protein n=1 Tax=Mycena indigotica TaxID=2126181 RepID=A0A8H6SGM3_9AGAR|nr:uncharacterized protein MIND_00872700 [Mycena indigotica]KAF7299240.1 hypothetical protein MIND_00872700 [Mycena indigotica]